MAKDYAPEALQTLAGIMRDKKQPSASRVSAATAILDRGYGRPPQAVLHQGHDGGALGFDPTKLTDDQVRTLLGIFGPLAGPEDHGQRPPGRTH